MHDPRQEEQKARLAGLFVVLALHGALFYSLWHYRILPPPAEVATLFVDLLTETPKVEPPKPKREPKPPKPRPPRREKPVQPPPPQQLAAQAQVVQPSDPVVPPPPAPPAPRIEAPAKPEPPPPPPPPRPADPVMLSGELAITCPDRTPPVYPSISRRLGEEGKVVLRVELDETGRIDRATVKTSSGYARLDEAALAVVRHWRCTPARRDGVAVRAVAIQPFNFLLEGR
jgi:protein TonB